MLNDTIEEVRSERVKKSARTEFKHGFNIPSGDHGRVRFINGRIAQPEQQSHELLNFLQSLRESDRLNLRRLFHTLDPPSMDALAGEYDAELLDQGGPLSRFFTSSVFGIHGDWFGKAFSPLNERKGIGCNCFHSGEAGESIVRKLPMDTCIGESTLDDGPSLLIRYQARNRGLIRWLRGEIRQITPHVMLGVGFFGPTVAGRDIYRRKIPFILVGPCRPYQQGYEPAAAPLGRNKKAK